jgi:6-pyruvoyltetrahydropterin/6-carboxytetrahydropterin synthase
MKMELKQQFQIESARFLPHLPEGHPCRRMHGHSFRIVLTLVGEVDSKLGWVIDYNEIVRKAQPVLASIDHCVLNEVTGLENPTSENLCVWLYNQMKPLLPILTRVTVSETPTTECSYPL